MDYGKLAYLLAEDLTKRVDGLNVKAQTPAGFMLSSYDEQIGRRALLGYIKGSGTVLVIARFTAASAKLTAGTLTVAEGESPLFAAFPQEGVCALSLESEGNIAYASAMVFGSVQNVTGAFIKGDIQNGAGYIFRGMTDFSGGGVYKAEEGVISNLGLDFITHADFIRLNNGGYCVVFIDNSEDCYIARFDGQGFSKARLICRNTRACAVTQFEDYLICAVICGQNAYALTLCAELEFCAQSVAILGTGTNICFAKGASVPKAVLTDGDKNYLISAHETKTLPAFALSAEVNYEIS